MHAETKITDISFKEFIEQGEKGNIANVEMKGQNVKGDFISPFVKRTVSLIVLLHVFSIIVDSVFSSMAFNVARKNDLVKKIYPISFVNRSHLVYLESI